MRYILVIAVQILLFTQVQAQPHFTDVASTFDLDETYGYGAPGGGISFCDFDGDGWDDLTFATEDGVPIHFFRNTGNGFEKVQLVNHFDQAKQVLWVDYDNDGDKDLYVATFLGPNRLYQNTGDLEFQDVTSDVGLPVNDFTTFGACWGDFDRDGWLDLYYGERKMGNGTTANRLFRNNADGTFTDISEITSASDPGKIPFCSAFLDYNNDNWPDIYTANDKRSINTLLRNNGDGTFSDVGEIANADLAMDAMCVAVGDYDNNGLQDIYISNTSSGNALLHNLGTLSPDTVVTFENVAEAAGTAFHGVAWGSNFLDADNDGHLDLYVCGLALGSDTVHSTFYLNDGNGAFTKPNAGFIGDTLRSFSNAVGDFDRDGYPDIAVLNHAPGKYNLWRNDDSGNNWIKVNLEGVISNRDAVGARIEVFSSNGYQMRQIHCGIGFLGQNSYTENIGLAQTDVIDSIKVTWPTGHVDRFNEVETNQTLNILEGSSTGGEIFIDPDITITTSTNSIVPNPKFDLHISPNPASTYVNIQFNYPEPYSLSIYNSSGNEVHSSRRTSPQAQIDLSLFPQGIYFVVLRGEQGYTAVGRFIKSVK